MFNTMFNSKKEPVDKMQAESDKFIIKMAASGKAAGLKSIPKLTGDSLAPHLESARNFYQGLYARYNDNHQADNIKELVDADKEHKLTIRHQLESKLEKLKEALNRALVERKAMPYVEPIEKGSWKIHTLLFLVALTETMFCRSAFSVFDRSNNLALLLIALGLFGFLYYLPIMLVKMYRKTKDSNGRYIIWGSVATVLIAGFSVLAYMRTVYLSQLGSSTVDYIQTGSTISLNPAFLLLLNIMFTVVTTLIYGLNVPDNTTRNHANNAQGADDKIAKLEREIENAEAELNRIPEQLYQGQVRRSESATESKRFGERINSLYKAACSTWMEENVIYRADQGRPDCFNHIIPNLIFSNVTTKSK